MTNSPFSQTPLFQLNLFIFLGWRSNTGFVRPIFREEGYQLYRIGPSITTSLQSRTRANAFTPPIPFQLAPSPDLLYRKNTTRHFLPIECKVSSFGHDREQAKQAAALLTCTGQHLAQTFGLRVPKSWQSKLIYAIGDGKTVEMHNTLSHLSNQLKAAIVDTTPYGVVNICIRSDGVYITADKNSSTPLEILKESEEGICVMPLENGEDPRPLYVIPLDPSYQLNDEYQVKALEERVRVAIATLIGSQLDQKEFIIQMDELMRAAIEVWDIWEEKNTKAYIKNAVRGYARQIFHHIQEIGIDISHSQDQITFKNITPALATRLRNYFISPAFRRGQIDLVNRAVQLDFSTLSEGW